MMTASGTLLPLLFCPPASLDDPLQRDPVVSKELLLEDEEDDDDNDDVGISPGFGNRILVLIFGGLGRGDKYRRTRDWAALFLGWRWLLVDDGALHEAKCGGDSPCRRQNREPASATIEKDCLDLVFEYLLNGRLRD